MSIGRQISMGDMLRASKELGVSIASIAGLLGYEWNEAQCEEESSRESSTKSHPRIYRSEKEEKGRHKEPRESEQYRPARDSAKSIIEFDDNDALVELSSHNNLRFERKPGQLQNVQPLRDLKDEKLEEPPEIDSLLYPAWSRAILYALLTRTTFSGDVNLEKTIEMLAQFKRMDCYPRKPVKNLRAGIQLLIDVNNLMDPYAEDQRQILTQIKKQLLADCQIDELYFSACPIRGAWHKDAADPYLPYRKPIWPGTPVLLLSDLCAGKSLFGSSSASLSEWLKFARELMAACSPVIALVPYPIHDIPVELRRVIKVVHWDRSTTTGMVERKVTNLVNLPEL